MRNALSGGNQRQIDARGSFHCDERAPREVAVHVASAVILSYVRRTARMRYVYRDTGMMHTTATHVSVRGSIPMRHARPPLAARTPMVRVHVSYPHPAEI